MTRVYTEDELNEVLAAAGRPERARFGCDTIDIVFLPEPHVVFVSFPLDGTPAELEGNCWALALIDSRRNELISLELYVFARNLN